MAKYRIGRADAEKLFPTVYPGRTKALRALRRRAKQFEGPWRIKRRGEDFDWTTFAPLREAIVRLDQRLKPLVRNTDADAFFLESEAGTAFIIREVVPDPLAEPPQGAIGFWHPAIVDVYRIAFSDQFKGATEFWGAYNCRRNVLNASLWSMHSNWPPVLAIDVGCTPTVAAALESECRRRIDADLRFVYHFGHLHTQVGANRSGTPACA
jgi:hypothetical protein